MRILAAPSDHCFSQPLTRSQVGLVMPLAIDQESR
jgi:hypothetical protein